MTGVKDKLLYLSISIFVVGIISLILENSFYQYVDKNGYLHESLFLPMGVFCVLLGSLGVLIAPVLKFLAKKRDVH